MKDRRGWSRDLRRLIKAHEAGKCPPRVIADWLARLNYEVHLHDRYVGPNCIVTWRYRRGALLQFNGANQTYSETVRDTSGPTIPCLAGGIDMAAVASDVLGGMAKRVAAQGFTEAAGFGDLIATAFSHLRTGSDETLK